MTRILGSSLYLSIGIALMMTVIFFPIGLFMASGFIFYAMVMRIEKRQTRLMSALLYSVPFAAILGFGIFFVYDNYHFLFLSTDMGIGVVIGIFFIMIGFTCLTSLVLSAIVAEKAITQNKNLMGK